MKKKFVTEAGGGMGSHLSGPFFVDGLMYDITTGRIDVAVTPSLRHSQSAA